VTNRGLLAIGVAVLALLWAGPLPDASAWRFSAHMLLHMGVVAVAAPLLSLSAAGGRLDPARRWPNAFSPVAASIGDLVIVWGWHAPWFHGLARTSSAALVAEQATFLLAGVWLWLAACGGETGRPAVRAWMGVGALLFTSIHMTLLGALFALAPRAVYGSHAAADALADQHLGGSIMLLVGASSYLAGGLWLARRGLRDSTFSRRSVP
jgi:putative membrane protein